MTSHHYKKELLKIFVDINDTKLMEEFLIDILTKSEWEDIILRWQIVKLLSQKVPQRDIAKKLKVSIAKITRGSHELSNERGGFQQILRKMK